MAASEAKPTPHFNATDFRRTPEGLGTYAPQSQRSTVSTHPKIMVLSQGSWFIRKGVKQKPYATEPHTQQSLIQAIVSYAPRRFRKSQGKLPSKISARALKESRRNFAPEFRLFPATLSYAPLLSGFASEAAEGRRRSETHPTLQRNRLSTHPRGVRYVRTLCFNAPHFQRTPR